jgi:RNA polymerase sigma-70 factor, ECF subfamily
MQDGPQLDPKTQFRELYEKEYLSVFRTIRAMIFDAAQAEDLAQEAFVRAYRARDRYRPTAPPGAWLHRIAVNVAISHLRRQKLARLLAPRLLLGPDSGGYEQAEARTVVERLLERLSPKLRAAVVLHFYHGYTREEIAAALGIPAGTVASRMAKAMTVMRSQLEQSDQLGAAARSSR